MQNGFKHWIQDEDKESELWKKTGVRDIIFSFQYSFSLFFLLTWWSPALLDLFSSS